RLHLDALPRRYTLAEGGSLEAEWPLDETGRYDLWLLGPNGFHRHFAGRGTAHAGRVRWEQQQRRGLPSLILDAPAGLDLGWPRHPALAAAFPQTRNRMHIPLNKSGGWYDLVLTDPDDPGFHRRLAGRIENGQDGWSEPTLINVEVSQID
ncbi:phospholipase domain-containing protein, partial [Sphingomonas elodea]|uniref:phospholipase domain-containing protein n=1 Tax=Sphingomonas elodea TaxID=179878 RepID=UPI0002630B23